MKILIRKTTTQVVKIGMHCDNSIIKNEWIEIQYPKEIYKCHKLPDISCYKIIDKKGNVYIATQEDLRFIKDLPKPKIIEDFDVSSIF